MRLIPASPAAHALAQLMCVLKLIMQSVEFDSIQQSTVVFQPLADRMPYGHGLGVPLFKLGNQYMIAVPDPSVLIMHDVIVAIRSGPNQTLSRKLVIRDDIGDLPLLAWVRNFAF